MSNLKILNFDILAGTCYFFIFCIIIIVIYIMLLKLIIEIGKYYNFKKLFENEVKKND